jgi:tetratricopeptide (TPR) repeat protein
VALVSANPWTAGLSAAVALLVIVWGITSSILAWGLTVQIDATDKARVEAIKNAEEARDQEGKAKQNEEKAIQKEAIAVQNEKKAKETAEGAIKELVALGEKLHNRLQSRTLTATPEVRKLREDVLAQLRQSLAGMGQKIEAAGTSPFAQPGSFTAMGDLAVRLGQVDEAEKAYQKAYDLVKALVEANPDDEVARANLAVTLRSLGDLELDLNGDARRARTHFTEARNLDLKIQPRPRGRSYTEIELKRFVAHDDIRLGRALLALGQPAEARQFLHEALTNRQAWAAAEPNNAEPSGWVMEVDMWLGTTAWHLDDDAAVREHFGQALAIGGDLIKQFPNFVDFKGDLAEVQGAYGDALLRRNRTEQAEKSYQESLQNLQLVLTAKPDDLSQQPLLALTHERLGAIQKLLGKAAEAEKHYQEALRLRTELLHIEQNNPARQMAHALALAHAGKHSDAAAEAARVQPKVTHSTQLLLQAAYCWAVCAAGENPPKRPFAEKAVEALRAATAEDYQDAVALETDPDLVSLHTDAAFQAVIARVKSARAAGTK